MLRTALGVQMLVIHEVRSNVAVFHLRLTSADGNALWSPGCSGPGPSRPCQSSFAPVPFPENVFACGFLYLRYMAVQPSGI